MLFDNCIKVDDIKPTLLFMKLLYYQKAIHKVCGPWLVQAIRLKQNNQELPPLILKMQHLIPELVAHVTGADDETV